MADPSQFSQSLRGWMDTFTHRSMRDWSRYIKASGFSMPQFFLLMHLRHREHCGISDLSEHMEISNAAASQLVDKLVQAKLLVELARLPGVIVVNGVVGAATLRKAPLTAGQSIGAPARWSSASELRTCW